MAEPADDGVEDRFAIPSRPERRFSHERGLEYEGETTFHLTPSPSATDERLASLVTTVLSAPAYTYGDWFDLPMPLYLVHDEETDDVFRVSVRDGQVRLHVLPATESAGLRAFYEGLDAAADREWQVTCSTSVG
jgi:hypothetical protein